MTLETIVHTYLMFLSLIFAAFLIKELTIITKGEKYDVFEK